MEEKPTKKPILGIWTKTLLWTIGIIFAMIYFGPMGPKTPEQEAAEVAQAAKEKLEQARNSIMRETYIVVRSNLRDPDSMKVELMAASANPEVACLAYRARNGFGGMVRDVMVWDGKTYQKTAKAWKKNCEGPHLQNITYLESSMDKAYRRRYR